MELVLHKELEGGGILAAGRYGGEDMRRFADELPPVEAQELSLLHNAKRRQERLAVLYFLHKILNIKENLYHSNDGCPLLQNSAANISISHTGGEMAAVALHPSRRTGVDTENRFRNFERIAKRFLSPSEQNYLTDNEHYGIAWCAKEAAYKAAGVKDIDFAEHLQVEPFACSDSSITLNFRYRRQIRVFTLQKIVWHEYLILAVR